VTEEKTNTTWHTLGPLTRDYRLRRGLRISYPATAILGLLGMAATLALGIWRWYFAFRHYGPAAVLRWSTPALWVSLGLGIVGLVGLITTLRTYNLHVGVHPAGLTYQRGHRREAIPWTHIKHIHTAVIRYGLLGLAWGGQMTLSLHTVDNRELRLTQTLSDLKDLVEMIKRNVYPGLLSQYREELSRDEPVPFGPLLLDRQGLRRGHQTIQWEDLEGFSLNRGVLEIQPRHRTRDSRMRIPTYQIPNIDLCIQLIQFLMQSQSEK
jgi:hypothetical protein